MTTDMRVTLPELATLLGVSRVTIYLWRKRELLSEPDKQSTRVLFNLETVRADVLRNRLKVNPAFLQTSPGGV